MSTLPTPVSMQLVLQSELEADAIFSPLLNSDSYPRDKKGNASCKRLDNHFQPGPVPDSAKLAIDTTTLPHFPKLSLLSNRPDTHALEFLFNPQDASASQVSFSDFAVHPVDPYTIEEEEDDALTPKPTRPRTQIYIGELPRRRDKYSLNPLQLDQLVQAYINAPLVRKYMLRCFKDDRQDGLPSIAREHAEPAGRTPFYFFPNQQFMGLPLSTWKSDETISDGGVALTDPKIYGSPIRFISRDYCLGANSFSVGQCTFLNLPYGVDVETTLRTEPPREGENTCRILLQMTIPVLERRTGKRIYQLVTEIDMTESITKAALAELADLTGRSPQDFTVSPTPTDSPNPSAPTSLSTDHIDWCALADELFAESDVHDALETVGRSLRQNLDSTETCTMQTLTLLAEIAHLRDQHQDFLILRSRAFHANGVPAGITIPWISQRLLHDWYGDCAKVKGGDGVLEMAERFRQSLVVEVARRAVGGETFRTVVKWGDGRLFVRCVPLAEGKERRASAWVCFVQGECDIS